MNARQRRTMSRRCRSEMGDVEPHFRRALMLRHIDTWATWLEHGGWADSRRGHHLKSRFKALMENWGNDPAYPGTLE